MPLSERFIAQFAQKYHRPVQELDESARQMLESSHWSGNIRELQNCIEKAVILSEGTVLKAKDIDARSEPGMTATLRHSGPDQESLSQDEEQLVREAVRRSGGNISAAARMLGVSRPTLYAKMKKYGL